MKKIFCVLLALTMIFSLMACTSSTQHADEENNAIAETPKEVVKEENEKAAEESAVSVEEMVLFDQNGVKVTVKGLKKEEFMGPALKLLVENNSDKNYTVQARNTSVNGYMMEPIFSCDVASGKKANDSLNFMDTSLMSAGIKNIANIETSFHVFNTEDWSESFDTEIFNIKTSIYDGFDFTYDDSGELLYENDSVRIISKGLSDDMSFMGPSIITYIENKSDIALTVQSRDVSVNGFMTDPVFSAGVAPGKRILTAISFMSTELEENDITAISEVELSFHIFDSESWENSVDSDPIHISFS